MECRATCGACCIAPSITSPIPGMPDGKPSGVRCVQLNEQHLCMLFGDARRPAVCSQFDFNKEVCGEAREEALDRMVADAEALGANAVVGMRYATSDIASGAAEILAYGTAVVVEDLPA